MWCTRSATCGSEGKECKKQISRPESTSSGEECLLGAAPRAYSRQAFWGSTRLGTRFNFTKLISADAWALLRHAPSRPGKPMMPRPKAGAGCNPVAPTRCCPSCALFPPKATPSRGMRHLGDRGRKASQTGARVAASSVSPVAPSIPWWTAVETTTTSRLIHLILCSIATQRPECTILHLDR